MRPLSSFSGSRPGHVPPPPLPVPGRSIHSACAPPRADRPLRGHSRRLRPARALTALRRFTARAIRIRERAAPAPASRRPPLPPRGGASLTSPVPGHSRPGGLAIRALLRRASASLPPRNPAEGGGGASAMNRRSGGTLARVVLACLCLGLYGADRSSKLPTPLADRRFAAESPSSRDRVARRLRPAGLRPAGRRLSRILSAPERTARCSD